VVVFGLFYFLLKCIEFFGAEEFAESDLQSLAEVFDGCDFGTIAFFKDTVDR